MNYLTRLIDATRYSWLGIGAALRKEPAFQTEVAILPFVIIGTFYFGETTVEKLLLFTSWMVVLVVELLNSAIEAVVDRIGSERHELSGMAKDMGSGAVHLSLITAAVIWVAIIFF
jgi:diacylglycerol kinase (ATP)